MAIDLGTFGLAETLQFGRAIRVAASAEATLQGAARATVRYLYRECGAGPTRQQACALVRFYKTHPFARLPEAEQRFARSRLDGALPTPGMKCLVLLATVGDGPGWNTPADSRNHLAIPLPSVEIIERAPMIATLIRQFGLDPQMVIAAPPTLAESLAGKTYNVFYVNEARGSSAIPAQDDFVVPYGIRSVLGFGGVLRSGDLFAVIMFTKTPVPEESAMRFRNVALEVKSALFNFGEGQVFETGTSAL